MKLPRTGVLQQARYIIWRTRTVKAINAEWERNSGILYHDLMAGDRLDWHLFHWAIDAGVMDDPGAWLQQTHLGYVAGLREAFPEAIEAEIRAYQKELSRQREANLGRFHQKGLY